MMIYIGCNRIKQIQIMSFKPNLQHITSLQMRLRIFLFIFIVGIVLTGIAAINYYIITHDPNKLGNVNIQEWYERGNIGLLQTLNITILTLSLPLMLFLWTFIFRPMEAQIKKNIHQLSKQRDFFEEKRDRLELALKGTAIGIWDWDIAEKKFYWSPVLIKLLGLDEIDDLVTDVAAFPPLLHPNDKETLNKSIVRHFKTGIKFEKDVRIKHDNGNWIWTRIRGQALWDDTGLAYRMLGSVEDITEFKEISIQTDNFIQGIEAANIAFAIINLADDQKRFSYASPAFCDLVQCNSNKILNSNINMFTGPETSMSSLDQIDYAFKASKKLQLKMYSYRVDGTAFWNELTLRPIVKADGEKSENYIIIFNDLTEALIQEKQEVSRQRTESLGTLAGSVAHEINNLLMPMTMAKDILKTALKEDCDPFAREQLDVMVEYANQAKEIVNGILTFSRKETKNLEKVLIYDELYKATLFIKNLLSTKTALKLSSLENDSYKTLKSLINTTELKQIIANLCKNAEDSFNNKSGKITITLSYEKLDNHARTKLDVVANEFAVISVSDNGSGIDSDKLEKIFEPLYTTKDIGKGTGLGLSVVVGILRSWGGGINVKSTLGKGTTFKIFIPIQKSAENYDDLADLAVGFENLDISAILNS